MLKVEVQATIFDDILRGMQQSKPWSAPTGLFYSLQNIIVPYAPKPTVLKIQTDRIGEPLTVNVTRFGQDIVGLDPRKNQTTYTTVAHASVLTLGVQLSRGENRIEVSLPNKNEVAFLIVRATSIVSLWEAFARVLFKNSKRIIAEQEQAITSRLATRLFEPFVSFQDLLPDIQSLQILSTRLASRGLIHHVGESVGVDDLLKALTQTTPVYKPFDKDTMDLFPALDPWVSTASQFGGREAHVWIPNVGISGWLAFLRYIDNQHDIFKVTSVSENEVVVDFQGEQQRHRFDFDLFGTDFLTSLALEECFKSITVTVTQHVVYPILMCAAAYPFDLFITEDTPIGNCRFTFDSDEPLDSDCPFDSDPIDPFTDGWVGLSLSGRFEQDLPLFAHYLDSFVMPSSTYPGDPCAYLGFYTQMIDNEKYDVEISAEATVDGYIQEGILWTLESPDTTRWDITPDENGVLVAVSGSSRVPDNFKVTKPDLSEASFKITNSGVLQVESPPAGGTVLMDTMYIKATDGTVWDVDVSNTNNIVTEKVFP